MLTYRIWQMGCGAIGRGVISRGEMAIAAAKVSGLACALVVAGAGVAAQRAQSPGGAVLPGGPVDCAPDFVGQQLGLGLRPVELALADLDGNGDLDLASTLQEAETVELHLNRCR